MGVHLMARPLAQRMALCCKSILRRLSCRKTGVRIDYRVILSDVGLSPFVIIAHDAELSGVDLGTRTSIGRYTKIRDAKIGAYCSISWNVTIGAVSHPQNHPSTHAFAYKSQFGIVRHDGKRKRDVVQIGNDVWIGCDVVIMPGITIGDGAIIGANSVVTKDVPPYAIMAGSPARELKKRFAPEEVRLLQEIEWWNWDDEKLKSNVEFFTTPLSADTVERIR